MPQLGRPVACGEEVFEIEWVAMAAVDRTVVPACAGTAAAGAVASARRTIIVSVQRLDGLAGVSVFLCFAVAQQHRALLGSYQEARRAGVGFILHRRAAEQHAQVGQHCAARRGRHSAGVRRADSRQPRLRCRCCCRLCEPHLVCASFLELSDVPPQQLSVRAERAALVAAARLNPVHLAHRVAVRALQLAAVHRCRAFAQVPEAQQPAIHAAQHVIRRARVVLQRRHGRAGRRQALLGRVRAIHVPDVG